MRSAPRASSCGSPMASIPPRQCASPWPISPPTKCSPAIVCLPRGRNYPRNRRLWHGRQALLDLARHLGKGERNLLGHQRGYGRALRRTGNRLSRLAISSQRCAGSSGRAQGRSALMQPSTRLAARISRGLSLPRSRRPTRRLWWARQWRLAGAGWQSAALGLARLEAVGRAERPVRCPSRGVYYSITLRRSSVPGRFQGRHGRPVRLLRDRAIIP